MSAFAVVYERSNTPVDPGVLERVMQRLRHRGPDGRDVIVSEHTALGHWHFWTTPEEVGERQPLEMSGLPFQIVLDGRLDNRPELVRELAINNAEADHLSDAGLLLHAYDRWGEHLFEHLIGEFALVILDLQRGELACARDALGDRTLFYSAKGTRLVIASEPWAVAAADGVEVELNKNSVADYFALRVPEDGQTLFKNVYELLPAHVMLVNASGERHWVYWQPDPSIRLRGRSDEEYAEEFRALLEQSVRDRLRSTSPVGVLMSGGLDSTSVACLAARMLKPQPLTTLSYVYDELTECDERRYIDTVKAMWGINSIQISSDDAWPYRDWQDWPHNPNEPEGNPYRLVTERTCQRAHAEGLRVLLTGAYGDHLYAAGMDWLADLVAEGRLVKAGRDLSLYVRYSGLRWTLQSGFLQRVARRTLNKLPGGWRLHRPGKATDWLTPFSARNLVKNKNKPDPVHEKFGPLLGMRAAESCTSEIFNASKYAIEIRHPYRDRRLVEFVLALPAYQLYDRGVFKHILRTAMRNILPELIRNRFQPTSMVPLYLRGLEREQVFILASLQESGADWQTYVNADWLRKHWAVPDMHANYKPEVILPWLCISYESWYKSYINSQLEPAR